MTARMSDERLEEIADGFPDCPGWGWHAPVADLLAEVERARGEEERLAAAVRAVADWAHGIAHRSGPCTGSGCSGCLMGKVAFDLRAALDGGVS